MIEIKNIVFNGNNENVTLPDSTISVAFHATQGNIYLLDKLDNSKKWTIKQGDKEIVTARDLANQTLVFNGVAGSTLEIRIIKELMS